MKQNKGKSMRIIGITGGVGSGKSTITNILKEKYNAYIIYTDEIAHLLMSKGQISYNLIVEHFGEKILSFNGEINRSVLGKIIYEDPTKRLLLNSLTHPYVMDYVKDLIKQKIDDNKIKDKLTVNTSNEEIIYKKDKNNVGIIGIETALPKEAGLKAMCDEVWYVCASSKIRRERLKKSRNYSDQKIDTIFASQMSEEEYRDISSHTLLNEGDLEKLLEEIQVLVEKSNIL